MIGPLLNLLLRLSIVYFLAEVWLYPNDPRFAGKAIPIRNLIIVGGLSLLFPAVRVLRKQRGPYPVWHDNLYLSIFVLDMAGNSFDLYDRYFYFDLLPHFHGSGAATVVIRHFTGLPILSAIGLANMVHLLLEAQEYYTDVYFGTHNVRGTWDVMHDLLIGMLGTIVYGGAAAALRSRSRRRARGAS